MTALTPIQLETARFIRDFTGRHGYGPTLREIGAASTDRRPDTIGIIIDVLEGR